MKENTHNALMTFGGCAFLYLIAILCHFLLKWWDGLEWSWLINLIERI